MQVDGDVGDAVPAQLRHQVFQQRLSTDGQHGLGPIQG